MKEVHVGEKWTPFRGEKNAYRILVGNLKKGN
jgi:hypothetical protein